MLGARGKPIEILNGSHNIKEDLKIRMNSVGTVYYLILELFCEYDAKFSDFMKAEHFLTYELKLST
jgi:hypothetical protein